MTAQTATEKDRERTVVFLVLSVVVITNAVLWLFCPVLGWWGYAVLNAVLLVPQISLNHDMRRWLARWLDPDTP